MKSDRPRLSRRAFLGGSLFAAGAAARGGLLVNNIVDSHVHFYDPARPGGIPWPPQDDRTLYSPHLPRSFRALTQNLAVNGVVVIEAEALPADNQWVLDLAKSEPLILGYIARLAPGTPNFTAHFQQYLTNRKFRGIRLKENELAEGPGQKAFDRGIQEIAEHGLTIDVVGGSAMIPHVKKLKANAPGLRVVLDHLPLMEWDGDPLAARAALQPVADLPEVYAKISYVLRRSKGRLVDDPAFYRPALDELWKIFGPNRVIYGSNWPVSDLMAPYEKVLEVVADYVKTNVPAGRDKFFWRNSQAAYGWSF